MTTTPPTTRARPAVRAGPADDIVVLDDDGRTDPSDPEDQASVLQRRSRVATAVAAVCVYEAAAEIANAALDVDLFPSISAAVRRITMASVRSRAVPPPWMLWTGALALGYAVTVVGSPLRRGRR